MGWDGVYKGQSPSIRKSINTGYIVLPDSEDRAASVAKCLRTERFSVLVEGGGGIMHGCYITKSALRDIRFPLVGEQLGSGVVFFSEPYNGKSVITGVVDKNDESSLASEEVITFRKMKGGNYALLTLDGNGAVNIDVIGKGSNGAINLNVRNENGDSKLNVHVKGSINIYTEGNVNMNIVDGSLNIKSSDNVNVSPNERFNIGEATEPMVKGGTLKENLDKTNKVVKAIRNSLLNWTVASGDGGLALKTAFIADLSGDDVGDFDKINSEKSYLE